MNIKKKCKITEWELSALGTPFIYFSAQLTETSFLEVLEKLLSTLFTEVVDLKDDLDEMRKLGFKKSCVSYLALYIKKIKDYYIGKHW